MNLADHKEFYCQSLDEFGFQAQADLLQEECAELIQAISKWRRISGRDGFDKKRIRDSFLCNELADVLLLAGEIAFEIGFEKIEKIMAHKKRRTKRLLRPEVEKEIGVAPSGKDRFIGNFGHGDIYEKDCEERRRA